MHSRTFSPPRLLATNTENLVLGTLPTLPNQYFKGKLECLQIFNRPLSLDEINEAQFCDVVYPHLRSLPEISLLRIVNDTEYVDYTILCTVKSCDDVKVIYDVQWVVDGAVVQNKLILGSEVNSTEIDVEFGHDVMDSLEKIEQVFCNIIYF